MAPLGDATELTVATNLNKLRQNPPIGATAAQISAFGAKTWTRDLPSLDVHYELADNWSDYAQYAQGFLAHNLNTLYVANPALNTVDPQSTTDVQLGTTWVGQSLTLSADVYKINFSNKIAKRSIEFDGAPYTVFYNLGGVKYGIAFQVNLSASF